MSIETLSGHPRNIHRKIMYMGSSFCEKVKKKIAQLCLLDIHCVLRMDYQMDAFQQQDVSSTYLNGFRSFLLDNSRSMEDALSTTVMRTLACPTSYIYFFKLYFYRALRPMKYAKFDHLVDMIAPLNFVSN